MRRNLALAISLAGIALTGWGAAAAGPLASRYPHRYLPGSLDGRPVTAARADGLEVAAWAYRSGAEYDLAIAFRTASGAWSEPELLGVDDRRDQIRPSVGFDAAGNLYVAYVEAERAFVVARYSDLGPWSLPLDVTPAWFRPTSVALAVVGNRLVVACGDGEALTLVDLALLTEAIRPDGIIDNPDPIDGREQPTGGEESSEYEPVTPEEDPIGSMEWSSGSGGNKRD